MRNAWAQAQGPGQHFIAIIRSQAHPNPFFQPPPPGVLVNGQQSDHNYEGCPEWNHGAEQKLCSQASQMNQWATARAGGAPKCLKRHAANLLTCALLLRRRDDIYTTSTGLMSGAAKPSTSVKEIFIPFDPASTASLNCGHSAAFAWVHTCRLVGSLC